MIEATDGFEHLGEAGSGEEALALVRELDPDLVLVDVRMPGINGFETARRLALGILLPLSCSSRPIPRRVYPETTCSAP